MQRGANSNSPKSKSKRGKRIPGICGAADVLGVHRNHLRMVLKGERTSHSLKRRYLELFA